MFRIYFENRKGEKHCLCTGTEKECRKSIMDYVQSLGYKVYYTNEFNIDDNIRRIDFGSHSEFCYLEKVHD